MYYKTLLGVATLVRIAKVPSTEDYVGGLGVSCHVVVGGSSPRLIQ